MANNQLNTINIITLGLVYTSFWIIGKWFTLNLQQHQVLLMRPNELLILCRWLPQVVPWLLISIQSMNHEMEIVLCIIRQIEMLTHQSYQKASMRYEAIA